MRARFRSDDEEGRMRLWSGFLLITTVAFFALILGMAYGRYYQ